MLKRIESGEELNIASDQYGCPTSANELAKFIYYLIGTNEYGTYHATCQGHCSRYEFAKRVLALSRKDIRLNAVPTPEAEISSVRPAYAVLDNFILTIMDSYEMPTWESALEAYMESYREEVK